MEDKTLKKQYEIVDHLMTVGWIVNHKYLDEQVIDKYDGDLKRAMWGKYGLDFYLISYCGKYTCTVGRTHVEFWRIKPKWFKLGKLNTSRLKFTENGIMQINKKGDIFNKILEVNLPPKKDENF